jgi:hypothetical protein
MMPSQMEPTRRARTEANTPTVVCVLGMHRSGTSVAARMLNLLGVELGREERMVRPAGDNPKGFWENRPIVDLNNAILARLGGNCVWLPVFPAGWESAPGLDDLRERALALVHEEFGDAPMWGWKDPRSCLTLPFWQPLLPPIRYVLCLRHPADVARSLERRSGMPREQAVHMWLTYMQRALAATGGMPRCSVFYDGFIDNPMAEVGRLAGFLGVAEHASQPHVRARIMAFLDADLRHHRSAPRPARGNGAPEQPSGALDYAQQAYATLTRGEPFADDELQHTLKLGLGAVISGAAQGPAAQQEEAARWRERVHASARQIAAVVPEGGTCMLIDDGRLRADEVAPGRRVLPFLERDGSFWGPPADDEEALRELERMRTQQDAMFLALAWPAFWWLEHYTGFAAQLALSFPCVLRSEHLLVYDLREGAAR